MTHISELLEESIRVEMNVAELYRLYSDIFEADRDFWMRLSMEEMNHAALLKSARQFLSLGRLPTKAVYPDIEAMRGMNQLIATRISEYREVGAEMDEAYGFARELEASAAEGHFQKIMEQERDDRIIDIFRKLAGGDLDHAKRIGSLIRKNREASG